MIRIKFKTRKDAIKGYYELSTKGLVRSLPLGIYEISDELRNILDDANIAYKVINSKKVLKKNEAIRNSLAVGI